MASKMNKEKSPPMHREPWRGLGVAHLENLGLQKFLKLNYASDQLPPLLNQQPLQVQFPFAHANIGLHPENSLAEFSLTFPPSHHDGGSSGYDVGIGAGSGFPGLLQVDPLRMLNPEMKQVQSGQGFHPTQMHCVSNDCYSCYKKRLEAENLAWEREWDKVELMSTGSLGLSLGRNKTILEEVGVQRNENSNNGARNLVMEYQFFPGSHSSSNLSVSGPGAGAGAGSGAGVGADVSPTKLDLSLKLSR